jgi:hypothetical protein
MSPVSSLVNVERLGYTIVDGGPQRLDKILVRVKNNISVI